MSDTFMRTSQHSAQVGSETAQYTANQGQAIQQGGMQIAAQIQQQAQWVQEMKLRAAREEMLRREFFQKGEMLQMEYGIRQTRAQTEQMEAQTQRMRWQYDRDMAMQEHRQKSEARPPQRGPGGQWYHWYTDPSGQVRKRDLEESDPLVQHHLAKEKRDIAGQEAETREKTARSAEYDAQAAERTKQAEQIGKPKPLGEDDNELIRQRINTEKAKQDYIKSQTRYTDRRPGVGGGQLTLLQQAAKALEALGVDPILAPKIRQTNPQLYAAWERAIGLMARGIDLATDPQAAAAVQQMNQAVDVATPQAQQQGPLEEEIQQLMQAEGIPREKAIEFLGGK